jgi:hypothetical protein
LKAIGGYFEFELPQKNEPWHPQAIALNNARNGFRYLLEARKPIHVFLPNYICNSMLEPLEALNIRYSFYRINNTLEIEDKPTINNNTILLYVNYFGVKHDYCEKLYAQYGNSLVIDNTQAFFEKPFQGVDTIYSARKFFGVSDGGYLYTTHKNNAKFDKDYSGERVRHLVGRLEKSATEYYSAYRISEKSLKGQPIKQMSALTCNILKGIDYEKVKLIRERNFLFLHNTLKDSNELTLNTDSLNGPMIYPYFSNNAALRQTLISQKVYVAKYWSEVEVRETVSQFEKKLVEHLIPLPIDQRCEIVDLLRILKIIHDYEVAI